MLAAVAPPVLARLLGEPDPDPPAEGAQLKLNMLLSRLPRLRDEAVDPRHAFAGTFHVNESATQLQAAYEQAARGELPALPPCEIYCHSLTDGSILSPALREAGAATLTLFGLHMPTRLFAADNDGARERALAALEQPRTAAGVVRLPDVDAALVVQRALAAGVLPEPELAEEALDQWPGPPPTHVFIQGGVGGVAAAVSVSARTRLDPAPSLIVVEPERAARSMVRRLGALGTFGFNNVAGDLWCRPELSRRDRSVVVISVLAATARDEERREQQGRRV